MISAILVSLMMVAQLPDGTHWNLQERTDAITGRHSYSFGLRGQWVGAGPGFPYKDAQPDLIISCTVGKGFDFASYDIGALVDVGVRRVEYRIDAKAGTFYMPYSSTRTYSADKFVFLSKGDTEKILKGTLVLLRVSAYNNGYLTAQFDIPKDSSTVRDACRMK